MFFGFIVCMRGLSAHMRDLLVSDVKKIELLKALLDRKVHTYYRLSRIVGTNYDTVKKNCRFLELVNFVEISRIEKEESASGVASYRVRITEKGLEATKNILKAKNYTFFIHIPTDQYPKIFKV